MSILWGHRPAWRLETHVDSYTSRQSPPPLVVENTKGVSPMTYLYYLRAHLHDPEKRIPCTVCGLPPDHPSYREMQMAFARSPYYITMQDGFVSIVDEYSGRSHTSHLSMTQELFDEIVIMRYYNMTEVERREAINRAIATQAETGADGVRKASGLPTVMERVDAEIERKRAAAHSGSK